MMLAQGGCKLGLRVLVRLSGGMEVPQFIFLSFFNGVICTACLMTDAVHFVAT